MKKPKNTIKPSASIEIGDSEFCSTGIEVKDSVRQDLNSRIQRLCGLDTVEQFVEEFNNRISLLIQHGTILITKSSLAGNLATQFSRKYFEITDGRMQNLKSKLQDRANEAYQELKAEMNTDNAIAGQLINKTLKIWREFFLGEYIAEKGLETQIFFQTGYHNFLIFTLLEMINDPIATAQEFFDISLEQLSSNQEESAEDVSNPLVNRYIGLISNADFNCRGLDVYSYLAYLSQEPGVRSISEYLAEQVLLFRELQIHFGPNQPSKSHLKNTSSLAEIPDVVGGLESTEDLKRFLREKFIILCFAALQIGLYSMNIMKRGDKAAIIGLIKKFAANEAEQLEEKALAKLEAGLTTDHEATIEYFLQSLKNHNSESVFKEDLRALIDAIIQRGRQKNNALEILIGLNPGAEEHAEIHNSHYSALINHCLKEKYSQPGRDFSLNINFLQILTPYIKGLFEKI